MEHISREFARRIGTICDNAFKMGMEPESIADGMMVATVHCALAVLPRASVAEWFRRIAEEVESEASEKEGTVLQ